MAENLRRIAFWILEDEDGEESIVEEKTLLAMGLDTEEAQKAALGLPKEAELKEVWVKRPLGEHKFELQQKCLDPNTMQYNPALEQQMRFLVLTEKWNFLQRPSIEAYLALPICVANYLDNILLSMTNPSAYKNANFTQALAKWQSDSAEKKESP